MIGKNSLPSGLTIALAYSGGPDATALAACLQADGNNVIPVYVQYRNGGGKTKKDLRAAKQSAQILGLSTEFIDVPLLRRIPSEEKSHRNRIILRLLSDRFTSQVSAIAIGTCQAVFEASGEWKDESNDDIDPAILKNEIAARDHQLITWDTFGVNHKAHEFCGLSDLARQALFATTSCQMWWKVECGNCYSCVERHEAFMAAFGHDPTIYRPNTNVFKQKTNNEE